MKMLLLVMMSVLSVSAFADAKQEEMMKKWKAYATPGAEHKNLAQFEGKWTYTSKMWETKDSKPEETKGEATFKMILGGRYLEQSVKGTAMGMPFEGRGLTAYDNVQKKYLTLWYDNMSTGIGHGEASFDSAGKVMTESGENTCPMTESGKLSYRGEWAIKDKNNSTYTMWSKGPEGKEEYKMMEMVYKRK